jgi:hypothetical protein
MVTVSFIAQTLTTRPSTIWSEHPRSAMTSPSVAFSPVSKICAQVKHLGYAIARRIRLYGEEFELVSDPFPEADGVAVHVTTKKDPSIRLLRIPITVLQCARRAAATALAAVRVESTVVGARRSINHGEIKRPRSRQRRDGAEPTESE